jgi:hypothetical protein
MKIRLVGNKLWLSLFSEITSNLSDMESVHQAEWHKLGAKPELNYVFDMII